jgi:hypothetical protein
MRKRQPGKRMNADQLWKQKRNERKRRRGKRRVKTCIINERSEQVIGVVRVRIIKEAVIVAVVVTGVRLEVDKGAQSPNRLDYDIYC